MQTEGPCTRDKTRRFLPVILALLGLLVVLEYGARDWCIDNGLRTLAARSASFEHSQRLDERPEFLCGGRTIPHRLFPVPRPWVDYSAGGVKSVYPPALTAWFHFLGRANATRTMILLNVLLLGAVALRCAHGCGTPAALALVGPLLFYAGTNWETVFVCGAIAWLFLMDSVRWRSVAFGLLVLWRVEVLGFLAISLALDATRRSWWSLALGLLPPLAGAAWNAATTGGLLPLHLIANLKGGRVDVAGNALVFLVGRTGPGAIAALVAIPVAVVLARRWNSTFWALLSSLACTVSVVLAVEVPLYPDFGLLPLLPFLVVYPLEWKRIAARMGLAWTLAPLLWIVVAVLWSPVNRGLHWGPRLLLPPAAAMTVLLFRSVPPGRALRLLAIHAFVFGMVSLPVLKQRQRELDRQEAVLAESGVPLITDRHSLKADHLDALGDVCVLLVFSEADFDRGVEFLLRGGERRFAVVTESDRPLFQLAMRLVPHYGAGFRIVPGGWLSDPLVRLEFEVR